jgi:hypothetical protein
MSKLDQIEEKINSLILKAWDWFLNYLSRFIPQKVKVIFQKFIQKKQAFIEISQLLIQQTWTQRTHYKSQIFEKINNFKINLKTQIDEHLTQHQGWKKCRGFCVLISKPFSKLFAWMNTLTPGQTVMMVFFLMASLLSLTSIFFNSHKIYKQETQLTDRAPASAEEITYSRPNYHKKEARFVQFNNVRVPVISKGINELKTLIIDFNLVTSNRYLKNWLIQMEYPLRDHLNQVFEPVVAEFPLTEEGRGVISQKIQSEVNDFILKHNIEGHILEVQLVYSLAN